MGFALTLARNVMEAEADGIAIVGIPAVPPAEVAEAKTMEDLAMDRLMIGMADLVERERSMGETVTHAAN